MKLFTNSNIENFNTSANNLTVIDTNLTDYQSLIPNTSDHAVLLIDSQTNGISQITEALEQYRDLDSISIFSHGDIASLQLGNANLSTANLNSYQDDLAAWGKALSANGDLLLYGCNVAAVREGLDFIEEVAAMTGADIAASNDLTGNIALGGDWDLEIATGEIESDISSYTHYDDVLGLKFNFTYDEGVDSVQKKAFELAGKIWADRIKDNVTINIHVDMADNEDLPNNTLGGAVPFFHESQSFVEFKNALIADAKTHDDTKAVNSMSDTHDNYRVKLFDSHKGVASTRDWSQVSMTRANAKALGFIDAQNSTLDGTIVMNKLNDTGVSWQYDYSSSSVGSSKIDFTTVAIHEIGHVMGFVSLVDAITPDNNRSVQSYKNIGGTSLDMFRYDKDMTRMIATKNSKFSVDGTNTKAAFSIGAEDINTGAKVDGYQGSHWKNITGGDKRIMSPVLETNKRFKIKYMDVLALDVIGWDRKHSQEDLYTLEQQAVVEANNKGNVNRNVEVGKMLKNWRWARGGSRTRLRQEGSIAQYLAKEGFFSVGAFRASFDFDAINAETNTVYVADDLHSTRDSLRGQDNNFDPQAILEDREFTAIATIKIDPEEVITNEDNLLSLSPRESNEVHIEDLRQLSPQLAKSLVSTLS